VAQNPSWDASFSFSQLNLTKFQASKLLTNPNRNQTMKVELSYFVLFLGSRAVHAAKINLCVKAREFGISTNLQGAAVQCWDEDWNDGDDLMTGTTPSYTASNGCVELNYNKKTPAWYNPCTAWDCPGYTNPDIYCKVTKANMYPVRMISSHVRNDF
jgi:hypothetical protein